MIRFESLPSFEKNDAKMFRILIVLTIALAIGIFIKENKNTVLALVGEHYENSLPIYSVETDQPLVSITFDAAWGDEDLDEILKILDNHSCKATFFVTGDWATKYPEAIKKISASGHDLGNHGANHKAMTTLSQEEMFEEIDGCHTIVKTITGKDMDLFRAPYGDYDESVVMAAKAKKYFTVQWDVDSLDWKDYGVDSIIKTVCEHKSLKCGSIVLLHNGSKYTAQALDGLLIQLENKGYKFVPVSELIYRENFSIDHTGRQYK